MSTDKTVAARDLPDSPLSVLFSEVGEMLCTSESLLRDLRDKIDLALLPPEPEVTAEDTKKEHIEESPACNGLRLVSVRIQQFNERFQSVLSRIHL